jgi:DNA-binding NarL/FixJ family response regulator
MPLRVAVVGEDPLARAGLVALLAALGEVTVSGQGSPVEARRLTPHADVVLWDAGPAGGLGGGFEEDSGAVIALVGDERQAVLAFSSGARGILPRDVGASRLAAALAAVGDGLLVIDESFGEALGRRDGPLTLPEPLTPRELEVLALLGQGLSNKAIAGALGISESTAKFHVNSILGKLGVGSRSEAIVHASRLGLVIL